MTKLAYYASPVPDKDTWFETTEGYRIYKDVPICRTGSQLYFGREIKSNEGYNPRWCLQDDQQYEVFRPLEEVTAPEALASFEGKSVLDLHPLDKVLIDALDEYDGISQGHMQNIRVGLPLPDGEFAGETPLLADLHVKNPELNLKVEGGTRQVSCGYRFRLAKDDAGRLITTKIRGNHIAVVPRGRAGPQIAIGDAVPPMLQPHSDETKGNSMAIDSRLMRAIGFQNWVKTATPEEIADALENLEQGKDLDGSAAGDAWRYPQFATNGQHEIFDTPRPDPHDYYRSSAASWPKPVMTTTTVEQLEKQAKLQDKDKQEAPNRLSELAPIDDMGSVADAQPRTMDFYNGRSFSEGRALHNQARIAQGLPPIREGRR